MSDFLARVIIPNIGLLADGVRVTLLVCLFGLIGAVLLGSMLALLKRAGGPLSLVASAIIVYCRSTPIYVQLVWVAYVWPEVVGWPQDFFTAGCVALALQSGGYLAETLRAGITSVSRGQSEAASVVGFSRTQTFIHIVLPQALLTVAPALVNQIIVILKASTLVSVIAIPDLVYQATMLANRYYQPVEILTVTALIYIGLITPASILLNRLAKRVRVTYGAVA